MLKYILIPVIVVAMGFVVVSLAKGIIAFLQTTRDDLESGGGQGPSPMQLKQNEMMFARIKYQALAVIVVAVLLAASR
ncbi:hypothetical protein FHW96_001182 [Novosphingobium sp. SG751A]|nr:hypothetical protein [Novosphingobium sp. SG751A]